MNARSTIHYSLVLLFVCFINKGDAQTNDSTTPIPTTTTTMRPGIFFLEGWGYIHSQGAPLSKKAFPPLSAGMCFKRKQCPPQGAN